MLHGMSCDSVKGELKVSVKSARLSSCLHLWQKSLRDFESWGP